MKKLFTLLVALGALTTVFAQDHSRDSRDWHGGYTNSSVYNHNFSQREKDAQIDRINHEFGRRIEFVEHNSRLRRREKRREIAMLERQRDQQIHEVMVHSASYAHDGRRF